MALRTGSAKIIKGLGVGLGASRARPGAMLDVLDFPIKMFHIKNLFVRHARLKLNISCVMIVFW